jgi:glycosyltransferase involved in cell wall biosynthesis
VSDAPLVSALISTYNRAGFVTAAVRSVLGQTVTDCECIVVDDGSTDETGDRLQGEFGDRIRYQHKANGGAASARNVAIGLAHGTYLAFLDSDDEWVVDHLAAQLAAFEAEPGLGLVYGEYHSYEGDQLVGVFPRRKAPSGQAFAGLLSASLVQTSTTMVPRAVAEANGPFNEAYRIGDEYDFFLRLSARWPIRFLKRQLVRYGVHGGNISRDPLAFNRDMLKIYRGLYEDTSFPPQHRKLIARRVARYEQNVARLLESEGRQAEANVHFRAAIRARWQQGFPKSHLGWWRTRKALQPPGPAG